jgi:hypothetical protein
VTNDDPYAERKKLTFEQAEGAEPLPTQLKLKELSPLLRSALWAASMKTCWKHSTRESFRVNGKP